MLETTSSEVINKLGITISYSDLLALGILIMFLCGLFLGVLLMYILMDRRYIELRDFASFWRRNSDEKRREITDYVKTLEDMHNKTNLRAFKSCSNYLNWMLYKIKE